MQDITALLETAVADEPANSITPATLLVAGRRVRRRRHIAYAGSAAGICVAGAAVALSLLPGTGGPTDGAAQTRGIDAGRSNPTLVQPSVVPTSVAPGAADRGAITKNTLPSMIQRALAIRLSKVDVTVLAPMHDIDLAAAIASAKDQYLNVQVTPAGSTDTITLPRCADLEGDAVDGDGYSGACSVTRRADGGYLVLRSGRTSDGKYAKTRAELVTGDGFDVGAESSNQSFDNVHPRRDPVVSHNPPLSTRQLEQLVVALASQR